MNQKSRLMTKTLYKSRTASQNSKNKGGRRADFRKGKGRINQFA